MGNAVSAGKRVDIHLFFQLTGPAYSLADFQQVAGALHFDMFYLYQTVGQGFHTAIVPDNQAVGVPELLTVKDDATHVLDAGKQFFRLGFEVRGIGWQANPHLHLYLVGG